MPNKVYKKGDLGVYKPFVSCIDDQTGEIYKQKEYEGIGIVIDANHQHFGWVKIWWQKYPFENPENEYLTQYIRHYEYDK